LHWLWILGVLAAGLLLVCLTRVGVYAAFASGTVRLDLRFGLLRFRIYPGRKKKKDENKPVEVAENIKEKAKKPAFSKSALSEIRDAVHTLWPPLKRALKRTRKGLRIQPLRFSLVVGGAKDPAAGAELYGYLHAGIWAAMPVLEDLLVIPDPHIHIGLDFQAEETVVDGEAGVTARIGTLFRVGLGVGIPVLRWFLRYQKKQDLRSKKSVAIES